jgi:TIR domain
MDEKTSGKPTADQSAAHEFLCELRTRITTQPLPYQYGTEARALESLREVFGQARQAMKKYPGCENFAAEVSHMLNMTLRPVTAKWHRAFEEGRLKSRDGGDEFRRDLEKVQKQLREFSTKLQEMAYGKVGREDELTPPALKKAELQECLKDLPFGILADPGSPEAAINASESDEVRQRRETSSVETESGLNAVGLALSGGGIRSATFCLGVTQVLAEKGLLRAVDFLSTVSGGGYTGSFLTRRIGEGASLDDVAGPRGPDPEPVRYLRQNAKFLAARTLKESWSMVTATLAGMLLNWMAPFLVIVAAALVVVMAGEWIDDSRWWWTRSLGMAGLLTGIALILYCFLLRRGPKPARMSGGILACCAAVTLAIAVAWLLELGYKGIPQFIASHWRVSGGFASLVVAGPAIVRFLPVLKNPAVRKIVLRILLFLAALVVPLLALTLFYVCCAVGHLRTHAAGTAETNIEQTPPVFISCAKEDATAANNLKKHLEEAGCKIWLDTNPRDLPPGAPWPPKIEQVISHECSAFIALISKTTQEKEDRWFLAERNFAAERTRKFADAANFYFPVVIDPTLPITAEGFSHEPHIVRKIQAVWGPNGDVSKDFCDHLVELQRQRIPAGWLITDLDLGVDGRIALGAIALILLIFCIALNINLTAPHRLYRNGLAKTFVQKSEDETEDVLLDAVNPRRKAPYHLINAALNVPSSMSPAMRDRRCDFFLFSKHWTGSKAAGYAETSKWRLNGKKVDLGTAMAISGAAFSSYMGLGSMPTLTALLTFLNVRLGFWIKKPDNGKGGQHPGFLCLLREMLGVAMSEKRKWLNLSDGGHIENMAVYELLRRRCKFIVCVDGEADPAFTFEGLMTLVRHAQIDFGIRIEPRLDSLRADAVTGVSETHSHLCRIHYPDGMGLLLYLKLSVTGNETEVIKRYRINHPEFPHQTTLDQFFDQEQFEAYRQLGVHVAYGLFSGTLMNNRKDPETVTEWFERLAGNLLEPQIS